MGLNREMAYTTTQLAMFIRDYGKTTKRMVVEYIPSKAALSNMKDHGYGNKLPFILISWKGNSKATANSLMPLGLHTQE